MSAARAVWLVARLALLRRWNMILARLSRRRSGARTGPRTGTARKRPGWVLIAFFTVLALFQVTVFTTSVVYRMGVRAEQDVSPEVTFVSDWTFRELSDAAVSCEAEGLREELRRIAVREARMRGIHDEVAVQDLTAGLAERYLRDGMSGFRVSAIDLHMLPEASMWLDDEAGRRMGPAIVLVAFLLALATLLGGALGPRQTIDRGDATLEWLFTFPMSTRAIVLSRAGEAAIANPTQWILLAPCLATLLTCRGYGVAALPLAVLASVHVGAFAGAARIILETVLPRVLPRRAVAMAQALLVLLSLVGTGGAVAAATGSGSEHLYAASRTMPWWLHHNPLTLPFSLLIGGAGVLPALLGAVVASGVALGVAVAVASRALSDGIVISGGPLQGARGARAAPEPAGRLSAIPRKELLSVVRDRTRLVQTLAAPAFALGLQVLLNPGILRGATAEPRHAVAFAFFTGVFVLLGGALPTLALEGPALWILSTVPVPLTRVLGQKAAFWASVAAAYAALALAVLCARAGSVSLLSSPLLLLLPAGLALYSVIGVGLGALATDPGETDVQRRVAPAMTQLYLLLSAMFAYAIYAPSAWAKFAQLVLSTLLAFALWQKFRDHAPYLLDPTAAPPVRVDVADGIIAALAFFVLQGLFVLSFASGREASGWDLVAAFALAGLLVCVATVAVLRRAGMEDVGGALGLVVAPPGRVARALIAGLVAGHLGAGVAWGYLHLADRVELLRDLDDGVSRLGGTGVNVWLLVLGIIAAPVFEEVIFRGILFNGFRRSIGPWPATFASAAVFAIAHPPLSFAPVFVLAVLAATAYRATGTLLAAVVAHMTYNAWVFAWTLG